MSVIGITAEWRIGSETGPDVMQRFGVAFERAGAELVDMGRHVFPLLPGVFEAAEQRQFDAEGAGPVVGPWAPLSAMYAEWKAKRFPGQPILVATEALRDGLTKADSPFGSREWSASQFVFGTRGVEYASHHQSGTEDMPVRAPFDLDSEFESDLKMKSRQGITSAMRAADLDNFVGPIPEGP